MRSTQERRIWSPLPCPRSSLSHHGCLFERPSEARAPETGFPALSNTVRLAVEEAKLALFNKLKNSARNWTLTFSANRWTVLFLKIEASSFDRPGPYARRKGSGGPYICLNFLFSKEQLRRSFHKPRLPRPDALYGGTKSLPPEHGSPRISDERSRRQAR